MIQTQGQSTNGKMLLRVRPRGFCAGVVRAVDIVELALEAYGPPVYVHHEIVHNRYVVDQLRSAERYSSKRWTRCRRARYWSSALMACRQRCVPRPRRAT